MSTTALIVEVVIIGFQVLVWMALIILVFLGYGWIDLSKLKDLTTVISLATIGVSYTLGVIFNTILNAVFTPLELKVLERRGRGMSERDLGHKRAYIIVHNSDAAEDLDRRFNRSSLIRATAINISLISVWTCLLVWSVGSSGKLLLITILFSLLVSGLSLKAWQRTLGSFYAYLDNMYELQKAHNFSALSSSQGMATQEKPNNSFNPTPR